MAERLADIPTVFISRFFYARRTVGAGRDLPRNLAPDAAGVVRPDELPTAILPLPAGEDFRAQRMANSARLDRYFMGWGVRGRGLTT